MKKSRFSSSSGATADVEALQIEIHQLKTANRKLECKVDILSSVVAMKDEMLKSTDERFSALKWEMLNSFHGDDDAFVALGEALKRSIHGWDGEVVNGTQILAPLVAARRDAVEKKLRGAPRSLYGEALADCLPELRRDYVIRAAENFGDAAPEEIVAACDDAFADMLRQQAANASRGRTDSSMRLGKTAQAALRGVPDHAPAAAPPPVDHPKAAAEDGAAAKKKSWFRRTRK